MVRFSGPPTSITWPRMAGSVLANATNSAPHVSCARRSRFAGIKLQPLVGERVGDRLLERHRLSVGSRGRLRVR